MDKPDTMMNRREMISSIAAVTIAAPVAAQTQIGSVTTIPLVVSQPSMTLEERNRQYAICQVRGHSPTIYSPYAADATWRGYDVIPPNQCKYCGTTYRFVVTLEETNKPE